ncbi:helix-hairpin-helix domain-containing protein [Agromyces soli]|uniref:Helix-hairpin-helix domain-containing protein n=1 Tax=Agromyces soli TaxID=659012 RepID=A0ABY4AR33_9MICO|nr:helix-hairpin-helix domain-containing protein [Agromyces soli]UOE25631.1 helix-hairpin-helix domain-containing protein [Agromyces soli]
MPGLPSGAEPDDDALALLAPSARRAGARTRIAVGAAVVVFLVALAVAALLSFSGSGGGDAGSLEFGDETAMGDEAAPGAALTGAPASPVLLVHVLGAVARPGLVELEPGARVVDAIAAAGGLTAEADAGGVNLARPVTDGEQLLVPRPGEVPPPQPGAVGGASGAGGEPGAAGAAGVVQLNTAGLAELDTLPRIGPALAQRILDWRAANGGFTSVEQLLEVAGIGDAVFAGLVDRVAL